MQCCGGRRWTFGEGQEGAKVEREEEEEEKARRWREMPKPLNPIEAQLQSFPQPAFRKIYQKSKKRQNFTLTIVGLNCGHKFVANTFLMYSPIVGENSPPLWNPMNPTPLLSLFWPKILAFCQRWVWRKIWLQISWTLSWWNKITVCCRSCPVQGHCQPDGHLNNV